MPDPSLPFLGVHLSRHIDGQVSLGPTALLAPRAAADLTGRARAGWSGAGGAPACPSCGMRSAGALAAAAAQYVPELRRDDFAAASRASAQALGRDGRLVDDFVVSDRARPARAQRALARGHLGLRAGAPDRRSRRAGAGSGVRRLRDRT